MFQYPFSGEHSIPLTGAAPVVTAYQKLLQEPTTTLMRSVDEAPYCADVAVLGYN
ncbi:hypothetical protein SAMN05445504_9242 [Burkholderia sp. CF099]|nr:hypothetical protein SAMN05445504_9242 [Burkholderia sp. CF099]